MKGRFRLDVIFHQKISQVIMTQVAGSGNKGIVTSVFNCQLTAGILFINMVVNGELLQS